MIEPGSRLGPYVVIGPIGAGGMGQVFRAADPRLGREIALKLLPPEFTHDEYRLALFRREALTLATLNHPGIAVIHGFEETPEGATFLVLELVAGDSLDTVLKRKALAIEECLRITLRIAEAVEAAHERGVVHRDLKPGNVMIGPKGQVKVLDFGLARKLSPSATTAPTAPAPASEPDSSPEAPTLVAGETPSSDAEAETMVSAPDEDAEPATAPSDPGAEPETMAADPGSEPATAPSDPGAEPETVASDPGAEPATAPSSSGSAPDSSSALDELSALGDDVAGTPGYMSPEQILGHEQGPATDVFALGCILYQALVGHRPFTGSTTAKVLTRTLEQEPELDALPARTPVRVKALLGEMLAKDPSARPAGMKAVREELEEALGIRRAAAMLAGEAVDLPTNLPPLTDEIIGRDREIAEALAVLEAGTMLTLTGLGGTGKTRLALELAHHLRSANPDGTWFVDLAPVTDPAQVTPTVARVLQVREEPGKAVADSLREFLQTRNLLLVLDNCEHVIGEAASLLTWVTASCPDVLVLATSREALAITGETIHAVPPLAVPETVTVQGVADSAAGRLFQEKAARAKPGFVIDDENAEAVAEICRRLDGIPLAVELAAARVKMLPPAKIRDKLDDRFRLLTGGSRTALPRQQTLLATMEWSHEQLAPLEQEMLRKLAVFRGGWGLEAATAAWEEDGDEFEVLDLLTHLADKSLVVVRDGPDGEPRYGYLETVRAYAARRLEESGEAGPVHDRHLAFFLALAEEGETGLVGPDQAEWTSRLDREHGNLLVALDHAASNPDHAEAGLRLAAAASRFWTMRGLYGQAAASLTRALAASSEPTAERAKALVRAAGLALYQGDFPAARPLLEDSLLIHRDLGDDAGVARSLSGLATVATYAGEFADAREHYEELLTGYRERGNTRAEAGTLHNLGFVALCEERPADAVDRFDEALGKFREVGDLKAMALTLADLATATARTGALLEAAGQLQVGLNLDPDLGASREGAYLADSGAEVAHRLGENERAARWQGAAAGLRETLGVSLAPPEQAQHEALSRSLDETLGEVSASERARGRTEEFPRILEEIQVWLNGLDLGGLAGEEG